MLDLLAPQKGEPILDLGCAPNETVSGRDENQGSALKLLGHYQNQAPSLFFLLRSKYELFAVVFR